MSKAFNISIRTIERVRQRFVEESLDNALNPRPRTSLKLQRLDAEEAPPGAKRWTLRRLADQMVVMGYVESISHESVGQVLKEEVSAWEQRRNQISSKADWQFTTEDARIKLKRLYPSIFS
ncbi:MAG: hypothetical protein WBA77_01050 [Microcoleaceae cyanobacterium]